MSSTQSVNVHSGTKRPPDTSSDGSDEANSKKIKTGHHQALLPKTIPAGNTTRPQFREVSYLVSSGNAVEKSPALSPTSKPSNMTTSALESTYDPLSSTVYAQSAPPVETKEQSLCLFTPVSQAMPEYGGGVVQQDMGHYDIDFADVIQSTQMAAAISGQWALLPHVPSTVMFSDMPGLTLDSPYSANYANGTDGTFYSEPGFVCPYHPTSVVIFVGFPSTSQLTSPRGNDMTWPGSYPSWTGTEFASPSPYDPYNAELPPCTPMLANNPTIDCSHGDDSCLELAMNDTFDWDY